MEDSVKQYIEENLRRFNFVLILYIANDSNENKAIVDDVMYEYEQVLHYIWATESIILHLDKALEQLPELGPFILEKSGYYPPGTGGVASEEDYRNWMKDLSRQLKERMAEYQSRSTDKDDLYYEKHYPNFRKLLIWLPSYGIEKLDVILSRILHVHREDTASLRLMISELKEVLEQKTLPCEYVNRIVRNLLPLQGREMEEADYRAWLEDVVKELEVGLGA